MKNNNTEKVKKRTRVVIIVVAVVVGFLATLTAEVYFGHERASSCGTANENQLLTCAQQYVGQSLVEVEAHAEGMGINIYEVRPLPPGTARYDVRPDYDSPAIEVTTNNDGIVIGRHSLLAYLTQS